MNIKKDCEVTIVCTLDEFKLIERVLRKALKYTMHPHDIYKIGELLKEFNNTGDINNDKET
jgi:hypothetical protein